MTNATMMNTSTAMTNTLSGQAINFVLPDDVASDFNKEDLDDDMDGMTLTLPRVKIPGGGVPQFEMPSGSPDEPDYCRTLTGIILYSHNTCAYWAEGEEYDDNTKPLCSSLDGKQGIGAPGGVCATCMLNQYGSAPDGKKGKACKNMRILYLLRSGDVMPLQVILPPTSLKPFRDFASAAFTLRRRASYGSLVEIGLKKVSNGSNDYSVATFRLLADFTGEQLAKVNAYAKAFREQMKALNVQRTANQAEMLQENYAYNESEMLPESAGDGFVLTPALNGERQALPA